MLSAAFLTFDRHGLGWSLGALLWMSLDGSFEIIAEKVCSWTLASSWFPARMFSWRVLQEEADQELPATENTSG